MEYYESSTGSYFCVSNMFRQSGQAIAGEVDRVRFDSQQVDTGECVGMRLVVLLLQLNHS
jgi:hypothetical protein